MKVLKSKWLWLNILALGVYVAQKQFDVTALPELDPLYIIIANLVVRLIAKEPEVVTPVAIV